MKKINLRKHRQPVVTLSDSVDIDDNWSGQNNQVGDRDIKSKIPERRNILEWEEAEDG